MTQQFDTGDVMTFGQTLRAFRLGFHELSGIGLVRVRAEGPPWLIDVHPVGLLTGQWASAKGKHRCWWDTAEGRELVRNTLAPFYPEAATWAQTFEFDDDGNRTI